MSSSVTTIISRSDVSVCSPRATLPKSTAAIQSGKCVAINARAASAPSIFIAEICWGTLLSKFRSIEASSECLNLFDLILVQPKFHRADDSRDLLGAPNADDSARHYAVSQSPCDGGFARVAVVASGDLFQLVRELQVARGERFLELRTAAAPVVRRQIRNSFASHRSGQHPGPHRRISYH